jgi:hypothetical protein
MSNQGKENMQYDKAKVEALFQQMERSLARIKELNASLDKAPRKAA